MLNLERQAKIIELIGEHGKVEVTDLSRRLNASEVTIRKDLVLGAQSRAPSSSSGRRAP